MSDNRMSLEDVAATFGVTTRTVRLWEKLGRLHAMEYVKGLWFHRLDVERLKSCIGENLVLSRRPAIVWFDSLRKFPDTIDWIGTLVNRNMPNETVITPEMWTYSHNSEKELKQIIETSSNNGWLRGAYREIEITDPEGAGHKEVVVCGKTYMLPPVGNPSMFVPEKLKPEPKHLTSTRLVIEPKDIRLQELEETINACPPFIVVHYYEISGSDVMFCKRTLKGRPKYN